MSIPPRSLVISKRHRSRGVALWLAAYAITFAVPLHDWLPQSGSVLPGAGHLTDTEYHVWVIGWVAQALATAPTHLFDAPFNHPAPTQLAGMDWFASSHLVSAPVYWLTGNPVLAANVLMLVSYPLAAVAMACLLAAMGCTPLVAWVGGLVFATGPLRLPLNLLLLEYQNVFLPLTALALVRLRDGPGLRPALAFGVAYASGLFSSYYMAAMLTSAVVLWTACELVRRAPGRARFAGLVALASVVAIALLVAASGPYLARAFSGAGVTGERAAPFSAAALAKIGSGLFAMLSSWQLRVLFDGRMGTLLGVCGLLALRSDRDLRRLAVCGLAITLSVLVVSLAWQQVVWWMPPSLRFFREPMRLRVLLGFGTALLVAAGLEMLRRRLGAVAGPIVVIAAAAVVAATQGPRLAAFPYHRELAVTEHAALYAAVGVAARAEGGGALLELPRDGAVARPDTLYDGHAGHSAFEPSAMLGGLIHRLPLVSGYTAYHPPHRQLVLESVARLPAEDALQDLVDMTHLKFLLLRPAAFWADPPLRAALANIRDTRSVLARDGWLLLRVERKPRHPGWFAAIAAGTGPNQTALGTPLMSLSPAVAVARLDPVELPSRMPPGRLRLVDLTVHNDGSAAWPVAAPPRPPLTGKLAELRDLTLPYVVHLVAEWRALPEDARPRPSQQFALVRDVPAGESVRQQVLLVTPSATGDYELVVRVVQTDGAEFDGPGNEPLRQRITVASH